MTYSVPAKRSSSFVELFGWDGFAQLLATKPLAKRGLALDLLLGQNYHTASNRCPFQTLVFSVMTYASSQIGIST